MTLNNLLKKFDHRHNINGIPTDNRDQQNNSNNTGSNNKNISIIVPYTKGLREKLKKTCNSLGIQVHFKGCNTMKTIHMDPKDKENKCQKSVVIYWFKCPKSNCQEEYIGESGRSFWDRLKEHLRGLSPIHHHSHTKGHPVISQCFTMVDREYQGVTRTIKEAMYICVNDPSLNRNLRKYQLPQIWNEVL